jgi:APA family basic amino acid/polyamine antiporter
VAFLYGWKCLLVMDPGLTAALAMGLGAYAAVMMPGLSPKAVALGSIVVVAIANVAGVRMASGIGYALGVAKIVMLVLLVVFGFASGVGRLDRFLPFVAREPGAQALLPALAGALVSGFFSFGGWWEASKLAGEVRDPQRTLPRALALGVATVTFLYVAVSAVFLYLVPREAATSGETFAAEAGAALFGAQGARAFSALVVVSVLGSLFAFMTMAPRVYFAMARDGAVPAFVGKLDARTGAPVRAIGVQASLALLLVALGTFDAIVAYFVFVTVAFLGLTVVGLVRLKRRLPPVAYETPFYPLPPVLFLVSISLVLVLLAAGRPLEAALGLAVVAAGVPAYTLLRRRATT